MSDDEKRPVNLNYVLAGFILCAIVFNWFGAREIAAGILQGAGNIAKGVATSKQPNRTAGSQPSASQPSATSSVPAQNADEHTPAVELPQSSSSVESQLPNRSSISASRADCSELDAAFDRALSEGKAAKARLQEANRLREQAGSEYRNCQNEVQRLVLLKEDAVGEQRAYYEMRHEEQLKLESEAFHRLNSACNEFDRLKAEFDWHVARVDQAKREVEGCERQ